jgi:histidine triad (HIT) family protein
MADCIFCRIIRGELPCAKVYEDEFVIGFLDINPINPGHTLVLPKRHYGTLFEISQDDLHACAAASQKIATAVYKAVKASGLNLFQNNYRAAGQLIDHIHFHLVPRFPRDMVLSSWPGKPCPQAELDNILEKIRAELAIGE